MTTWRDQPVPGRPSIPAGSPRLERAGTKVIAPPVSGRALQGLLSAARTQESVATVALSMRTRWALMLIALLDLAGGYCLIAHGSSWCPAALAPYLSWGGHWLLVGTAAVLAGAAIGVVSFATRFFAAATRAHVSITWGAVIVSVATVGPSLIAVVVFAALMALLVVFGGVLLGGAIVALVDGA